MSTNDTSNARTEPRAALAEYGGSRNSEDLYESQWVDTGLTSGHEQLPSGKRGFNVSKTIRHKGMRKAGGYEIEDEADKDSYGTIRLPNWVEGWGQYVEEQYGHRNAFAALSVFNGDIDLLVDTFSQGVEKASGSDRKDHGTVKPRMKDAETVIEKTATKLHAKMEEKQVDSGVVQSATPILIDPDFINTVRAAAPILDVIDVVAQDGFTASYNVVSAREEPSHGWISESTALDVSGSSGSSFTMPNESKDMKIWLDKLQISDFAAMAQSSLDFMDLEGTSVDIRTQEWATEEAETIFYGDPDGGLSDGSAHDSNAPEGMNDLAGDADSSHVIDKSGVDLSGDKALFSDIRDEVLALVKDTGAQLPNIQIATSFDMFAAMEDEANVNVRLDAFDQGLNFGRDPTGATTLSIANRPVIPEPNIRDHSYGSGEYDGNVGDVFLFEQPNFQRRALQSLSSTPLGKQGLSTEMALFQFETPISKSQGEHIRVLQNYSIDSL